MLGREALVVVDAAFRQGRREPRWRRDYVEGECVGLKRGGLQAFHVRHRCPEGSGRLDAVGAALGDVV